MPGALTKKHSLVRCEYSITGERDFQYVDGQKIPVTGKQYNCIAWAVGVPTPVGVNASIDEGWIEQQYDPPPFDGRVTYKGMNLFFNARGLTCINPDRPLTIEDIKNAKVLLYPLGTKFHAAKRSECSCGDGKWIMYESKLGPEWRIEHVWDQLSGKAWCQVH